MRVACFASAEAARTPVRCGSTCSRRAGPLGGRVRVVLWRAQREREKKIGKNDPQKGPFYLALRTRRAPFGSSRRESAEPPPAAAIGEGPRPLQSLAVATGDADGACRAFSLSPGAGKTNAPKISSHFFPRPQQTTPPTSQQARAHRPPKPWTRCRPLPLPRTAAATAATMGSSSRRRPPPPAPRS